MKTRSLFITLSAGPLAVGGLLALSLVPGELEYERPASETAAYVAIGLVALAAAVLVALDWKIGYVLEGVVGFAIGGWFLVVTFISIFFVLAEPEFDGPTLNTLVYFVGLGVGLAAAGWTLAAGRAGWRSHRASMSRGV